MGKFRKAVAGLLVVMGLAGAGAVGTSLATRSAAAQEQDAHDARLRRLAFESYQYSAFFYLSQNYRSTLNNLKQTRRALDLIKDQKDYDSIKNLTDLLEIVTNARISFSIGKSTGNRRSYRDTLKLLKQADKIAKKVNDTEEINQRTSRLTKAQLIQEIKSMKFEIAKKL